MFSTMYARPLAELAVNGPRAGDRSADRNGHGAVFTFGGDDPSLGKRELRHVLDDLGLRRDRVDAAGDAARVAVGLARHGQGVAGSVVSRHDLDRHATAPLSPDQRWLMKITFRGHSVTQTPHPLQKE